MGAAIPRKGTCNLSATTAKSLPPHSHGCSTIQCDFASPLEGIREEEARALQDPKRGTFPTRRGAVVTFGHEGWYSLFARVVKVTRLGLL